MDNNNITTVEFNTLDDSTVWALRKKCIREARIATGVRTTEVCLNGITRHLCCTSIYNIEMDSKGDRPGLFRLFKELIQYCGKKKRIFYQNVEEKAYKGIALSVHISRYFQPSYYCVEELASALKYYCEKFLGYYLPLDIHLKLLITYRQENNKEQRQKLIKRIPFILDFDGRDFFMNLIALFRNIVVSYETTETTLDNLLDTFAPILIKNPNPKENFSGFTKKLILIDLIKADYINVPVDFFYKLKACTRIK